MTKILLTGGSGFLGSHIAACLVREGYPLRLLLRKNSELKGLKNLTYEAIEGDLLNPTSIEQAVEGVDAVIHTAGNVSSRRRDKDKIFQVNVDGTENILKAVQKHNIPLIYTSSMVTIGVHPEPILLNEQTPWVHRSEGYEYVTAKRMAEEMVLPHAVVLNPGFILGPGDVYGTSTRLVSEFIKGKVPMCPRGGLSFCDVREVAKAHVQALKFGKVGERYLLAGQNKTYLEFFTVLAGMTHQSIPKTIPAGLETVLGFISECAAKLTKHAFEDINLPVMKHTKQFAFMDSSKAIAQLHYRIPTLEKILQDTLADLIEHQPALLVVAN